jgi:hypothetical protein
VPDAEADAVAEALLGVTTALVVELAPGIERMRRRGPAAQLAGVPVAGVFEQPPAGRSRHRSGRPGEPVLRLAEQAAADARGALSLDHGEENPALLPLALGAFYVAEARRSGVLGLGDVAHRTPAVAVLEGEAARRDPALAPGARLLRIWARLEPDGDVCVELRFPVA